MPFSRGDSLLMKLLRPLVILDCETTGVDPSTDRIVQIAIVRLEPATLFLKPQSELWQTLINPGRPIPADVQAVHGITDEMVKDVKPFAHHKAHILEMLAGADLAGYSLRLLDLPILDEELRRCGSKLNLDGVAILDAYGIFAKLYPRRLEDAVRVFCGREMTGQHDAMADTLATLDVLRAQATLSPLASMDVGAMAKFSQLNDFADLAGKLYRDPDGDLRYAFGKSKGLKVGEDIGFARWMLDKATFPGNTCDVLRAELDRLAGDGDSLF